MKIYIAGKIGTPHEKKILEKIASICESLGHKTFLPHRDVGLCQNIKDTKRIFEGDIKQGFKDVSLVIALLDGLHVGAGTAWEIGYAYAKKIPIIGLKTDEPISEALDYLSAIIIESVKFVTSFKELENYLKSLDQES